LSWDALLQDAEGRLESAPEPVSPAPAADRCTFGREISGYVAAALARLSPQQRMVFALRHYEGYGLQQIAVMMSCSEGAVKRYLFDATDRLRRRLRPVLARGAA
jgi:RNA polymerase sigma-70 factor (ECF subfamily)